jgi:hypothetical protein
MLGVGEWEGWFRNGKNEEYNLERKVYFVGIIRLKF